MSDDNGQKIDATTNGLALLTERAVGKLLGLSVITLRKQRYGGGALPYVQLGRTVRYRATDVEAYINAHLVGATETKAS